MTNTRTRIEEKLTADYAPSHLEVIDESEQHRGHGGWREGGETHFRVVMRSAAFDALSKIQRSRAVHATLRAELQTGVHALSLDLRGIET